MRCLGWVALLLVMSSSAHAGTWGESWGSMLWGAPPHVPSLGWVGGALLVSLLVGLAWWRKPGRAGAVLGLLLALGFAPVAEAQTVSVPNTFSNGSVAEANAMNENFTAVENGVNAALTTGSVTVPHTFSNGTTANADEVNANFTAVVDGVNTALSNTLAELTTCETNLDTCGTNLGICGTNLGTCETNLGTCGTNLAIAEENQTTAEGTAGQCLADLQALLDSLNCSSLVCSGRGTIASGCGDIPEGECICSDDASGPDCEFVCGNGIVEGNEEECDDGNKIDDGNGCDANCKQNLSWILASAQRTPCNAVCGQGNCIEYSDPNFSFSNTILLTGMGTASSGIPAQWISSDGSPFTFTQSPGGGYCGSGDCVNFGSPYVHQNWLVEGHFRFTHSTVNAPHASCNDLGQYQHRRLCACKP